MKRCTGCQRHLLVHEPSCPFCGVGQGPLPRAPGMVWVLVLGLATASCVEPGVPIGDGSGSSDGSGSASSGGSSSAASITATSTTSPSTTSPSTSGTATMDPDGDTNASDTEGKTFVFYGAADSGSSPFECDLYEQDCPAGEKCMPWANDGNQTHNATRCSPITRDPDAIGDPCTVEGSGFSGIDSCVGGAICAGVDPETNQGHCVELCGGIEATPTCQAPGVACTPSFELPIPLCLVPCDPRGTECPVRFTCTALEDAFGCVPQL